MGEHVEYVENFEKKRVMSEPEQYEFPKELHEFGYHFNDAGQLRTIKDDKEFTFVVKENDHNYNQQHYDALGSAVTEELDNMMVKQYKLQKSYLPVDADTNEMQSYVFISGDLYTNSDKMMILVHGSGAVRAGQWSRRLIINDNLEKGSQLPYIKWARENGYSVIVANTNLNFVDEKKKKPVPIRGNGSPEEHVESLWREFVQRSPAKNIVIVAHSYGGVCAASLCLNHIREFEDRVFAVVLTDSVHGLRQQPEEELIKFFQERAMNWASAYDKLDTPLETTRSKCPTVSAGTDVHELTSYTSMGSIFKYIPKKYDQKVNPEKYQQEQEQEVKQTAEALKTDTPADTLIDLADETKETDNEAGKGDLTAQLEDVHINKDTEEVVNKEPVNPVQVEIVDEKESKPENVKSEL